jgi:hypothetical protein
VSDDEELAELDRMERAEKESERASGGRAGERAAGTKPGSDTLEIDTTWRWQWAIGAGCFVLGGAILAFAYKRGLMGGDSLYEIGGTAGVLVLAGLIFGPLRTGVRADRARGTVAKTWSWLLVSGKKQVAVRGGAFHVERSESTHDGSTVEMFAVCYEKVVLTRISENQDGKQRAPALATSLAQFLGRPYRGVRDSAAQRRRDRWLAKNAHLPLVVVAVGSLVFAIVFLLLN